MKKIIFIIAAILASLISASSQDRITTTDQQVLEVYIVEKNDKTIKYHLANDLQQTLFETKLSNLRRIEYASGMVDQLGYENIRMQERTGITTGITLFANDGGMFTFGADYFLSPALSLTANVGSDNYYAFGAKLYHARKAKPTNFAPFIGLQYGKHHMTSFWEVPVGIQYVTNSGLQFSLQVSLLEYPNINYQNAHAGFSVGWRF